MGKKNDNGGQRKTAPEIPAVKPATPDFPPVNHMEFPAAEMADVQLPPYNPPVPNRAWTEMRLGKDIEELSEDEKRDLYIGRDNLF